MNTVSFVHHVVRDAVMLLGGMVEGKPTRVYVMYIMSVS